MRLTEPASKAMSKGSAENLKLYEDDLVDLGPQGGLARGMMVNRIWEYDSSS